jgi:glycerol-3-phosphate acyltransferase PlsY
MVTVPLGAVMFLVLAVLQVDGDFNYTKTIFGAFATAFVLLTHLSNIQRLIKGTEPKIGEEDVPPKGHRQGARTTP